MLGTRKRFVCKLVGGAAWAALVSLPVHAADLGPVAGGCAVSGINGKLEGAGGFIDQRGNDGGRGHGLLSVTGPLGCLLGFQVDGGIGGLAGKTAGGVAGHLFTRDPESYLLGAYGQWSAVGKRDVWRVGVEGEVYFGNFTFEALGGYEDTDVTKADVFAAIELAYYATENLRLYGGYNRLVKVDAAAFGVEWMPQELNFGLPVSLFAHAAVGSKSFATVYGGLRFYFGSGEKSLIRRHREDDPGAKGIFQLLQENFGDTQTVAPPSGTDSKYE